MPTFDHPVAPIAATRGTPYLTRGLLLAAAVAGGAVLAQGWQALAAADDGAELDGTNAVLTAPAGVAPRAQAPALQVALTLGGTRLAVGTQPVALPAGAVFGLSLRSQWPGTVQVLARNPQGQEQALWSGAMPGAGQRVQLPALRLQGARGMETLRIVFEPSPGVAGPAAQPVVQQVRVLHV